MAYKFIHAAVATNLGLVRRRNEDNYYFCGSLIKKDELSSISSASGVFSARSSAFAVFDGMGGFDCGDVASRVAAQCFKDYEEELGSAKSAVDSLKGRIYQANDKLCSLIDEIGKNMGTTIASAAFKEDKLVIANVGDSRIYRFFEGKLEQLTVDHTEAQSLLSSGVISEHECMDFPFTNRLTQFIGLSPEEFLIEPHIREIEHIQQGEKYLICSDGLYNMLDNEAIGKILSYEKSEAQLCSELVCQAIKNGGRDNVTVMVLQVKDDSIPDIDFERTEELPPSPTAPPVTKSPALTADYAGKVADMRRTSIRYLGLLLIVSALLIAGVAIMRHFLGDYTI
ncbi:MAG: protein phosphatase 2C domain-containing protein [Oscillospiraceae bacterium]|nr:protein phosphatase 2C domain-containing protein [Oscillospiraceae bacterium]